LVVTVGLAVRLAVVAPVFHRYDTPPVAVKVAEEILQLIIPFGPAEPAGVALSTVTTTSSVPLHPFDPVAVTVYVVVVTGFTVTLADCAPVLHT